VLVRRFAPDEWRMYRDLRLSALRDSPDAFGSTLAREAERSDDEWSSRLARGAASVHELPLVAERDGEPAGLAWMRIEELEPDVAHLYQMWVAPTHRRFGVGKMLIEAAIQWARAAHAQQVALDVTCENASAVRLYSRAGFAPVGDPKPLRAGSALRSQSMRLVLKTSSIAPSAECAPHPTGDQ
jgi:ribosomal protein S18 acetylase RimI-like enzyme